MPERYKKFYEENWEEGYSFWHKVIDRGEKQVEILKRELNKINKNKIKVLDVGCGEGDETKQAISQISEKEFEITANDSSKEALEKYKVNNPQTKRIIESRLEDLPEKLTEKFDFILFSHCLYGVKLENLFSRYLNALNAEGIILIFQDTRDSSIKQIQARFWNEVNGGEFDETAAEDIESNLTAQKISKEVIKFPYYIYLDKLDKIKPRGFVKLFLPFAMSNKQIKEEMANKIEEYSKTIEHERKLENKTFCIIIKK